MELVDSISDPVIDLDVFYENLFNNKNKLTEYDECELEANYMAMCLLLPRKSFGIQESKKVLVI